MTDVHPSPAEIKPYVAVGPSKELSITVHKETFDSGFIAFTIFAGFTLLIIVGVTIFFAYQHARLPPPPPPLPLNSNDPTLHSNIGAAVSATAPLKKLPSFEDASALLTEQECRAAPHTLWSANHCKCEAPFFGPSCSQEKHDPKYFAVGTPNNVNLNALNQGLVSSKSFGVDSCSTQCSSNPQCVGFLYQRIDDNSNRVCTLLTGNVIVPSEATIPYACDQESTLYLRSSNNLHFENRIFLGGSTGSIPPRFWLVKEQKNYIQLAPYEIATLSFTPTFSKIYGPLTGIYCRHPFTADDIDILLERGSTNECYIHKPGIDIKLPPDWLYQQLYVVYV